MNKVVENRSGSFIWVQVKASLQGWVQDLGFTDKYGGIIKQKHGNIANTNWVEGEDSQIFPTLLIKGTKNWLSIKAHDTQI